MMCKLMLEYCVPIRSGEEPLLTVGMIRDYCVLTYASMAYTPRIGKRVPLQLMRAEIHRPAVCTELPNQLRPFNRRMLAR